MVRLNPSSSGIPLRGLCEQVPSDDEVLQVLIPLRVEYPCGGASTITLLKQKKQVLIPLRVEYPCGEIKLIYTFAEEHGLNPSSSGIPLRGLDTPAAVLEAVNVLIPLRVEYPCGVLKQKKQWTFSLTRS